MKRLIVLISIVTLGACRPENHTPTTEYKTASAVEDTGNMAVSEPASSIVSQILNSPQEQDILATSKQAMDSVTASEVAAVSASMAAAAASVPEESNLEQVNTPEVHLPETCERYYQRVDRCFSKQPENSAELRQMNQDARLDLVADKPTDQTCLALNESFNAVARNLGCE